MGNFVEHVLCSILCPKIGLFFSVFSYTCTIMLVMFSVGINSLSPVELSAARGFLFVGYFMGTWELIYSGNNIPSANGLFV